MRILILIMMFLLTSCSNGTISKKDHKNHIFSTEMNLDDFKNKLIEYSKNSPYPSIDE